jgi:hypothetical protein
MPWSLCLRSPSHETLSQGRAVLAADWQQWSGLSVRWRPAHSPAPSDEPHLQRTEVSRRPCAAHTTSWLWASEAPASPVPRASALLSSRRFAPRIQASLLTRRIESLKSVSSRGRAMRTKKAQPRIQMQDSKSGFPLRSPLTGSAIRLALAEVCKQPANPSIERTRDLVPV